MLQGSSNRTLMSKINCLCNFSYLSCADITLSEAPSSAPAFFLFEGCKTSFVRNFRESRVWTILEVKNLRNVKSPPLQVPQTLKLARTRGSESFITRKCYRVYWTTNICVFGFSPIGLRIMGGVLYLLNFRFWPGVKRPNETNLIEN